MFHQHVANDANVTIRIPIFCELNDDVFLTSNCKRGPIGNRSSNNNRATAHVLARPSDNSLQSWHLVKISSMWRHRRPQSSKLVLDAEVEAPSAGLCGRPVAFRPGCCSPRILGFPSGSTHNDRPFGRLGPISRPHSRRRMKRGQQWMS